MVRAVSVPASEYEMNPEGRADFERLKKLLDRLGKAMITSAEAETSEINLHLCFQSHETTSKVRTRSQPRT